MNVVVIVSAIVTSQEPLAYTPTRSAFTPPERFTQTLKTIERVYQKVPNAYVVLDGIIRRIDFNGIVSPME